MKEIALDIDFADSSFKCCEISEKSTNGRILTVHLTAWNGKDIKINFYHTLQFFYKSGSVVKGLYEMHGQTNLIKEALSLHFKNPPNVHNFKEFALVDIEDFPFLVVVAEAVQVANE